MTVSIHHWAGGALRADATIDQEIAAIDAVRRQHVGQGWPDYAYHLTACASGRVYLTGRFDSWRYVAAGGNDETIGLALPGNFMESPPSDLHLATVRGLVAEVQYAFGPEHPLTVVPHKFYGGTACPGNTWDQWSGVVSVGLGNQPQAVPADTEDQRQQDADLIVSIVDGRFDPVALLALAIAEAEPLPGRLMNPTARRPVNPADDARRWPDVSGGPTQQTVRWSSEYTAEYGLNASAYPGSEFVESVLSKYYNPEYALRIAADKLAFFIDDEDGDIVDALNRYNKPAGNPKTNPNRRRYSESYDRAVQIWLELGR